MQKFSLKYIHFFIFMSSTYLFLGCSTDTKFKQPTILPHNQATIYLYKPLALFGAVTFLDINITQNSKNIYHANLKNGSFLQFNLHEGNYTIEAQTNIPDNILTSWINYIGNYDKEIFTISIENKNIYCYKFRSKITGITSTKPYIERIKTQECLYDLKKM